VRRPCYFQAPAHRVDWHCIPVPIWVFLPGLPCGVCAQDIREREVEDLFYKYGRIRSLDLKVRGSHC
jgi:hypothetical protein